MASSSGGAHSSNEYTASVEHDFSTGSLSPQTSKLKNRINNPNSYIPATSSPRETQEPFSSSKQKPKPNFESDKNDLSKSRVKTSQDCNRSNDVCPEAESDCLKWSSLLNRYQELSFQLDHTEDLESKCEQQLASIRARKNLLLEVHQETKTMLNDRPKSLITQSTNKTEPPKSSTLPHGSRSTLSSPGLSTKSRSSTMSTLPPGFEGSSIPLKPKAAPNIFPFSPQNTYNDPLDFLGPGIGPYFFPNNTSHFLENEAFKEGQLITVSSESSESLDDATALEELTSFFGTAGVRNPETSATTGNVESNLITEDYHDVFLEDVKNSRDLMEETSSDVSALMQRFLKFSELQQNDFSAEQGMEANDGSSLQTNDKDEVFEVDKLRSETNEPLGENSRPNMAEMFADNQKFSQSLADSQPTTTADDAVRSSGCDSNSDVESLKSEIYVLRNKVQKLVNFTPEHANKQAYRSKIAEVQNQLRCLEEMVSSCSQPAVPPPSSSQTTVVETRHSSATSKDKTSTKQDKKTLNQIELKNKLYDNVSQTDNLGSEKSASNVVQTRSEESSMSGTAEVNTQDETKPCGAPQKGKKLSGNSTATSNSATLRKERHNYTKMVLEYIHKMRQLNIQLLKDKINRKQYYQYYNSHYAKKQSSGDATSASQTFLEEEDLLLLAEELDLHQQKVMELEQRLGNWHLWLLECSTAVEPASTSSATDAPEGTQSGDSGTNSWTSRWDAMKSELDMLAVESENTCTLVRIALTRHNRLRSILQQKGVSITAPSGSDRRRKPNNASHVRGSHHKRRGAPHSNSSGHNDVGYSGMGNSGEQSVWVERNDKQINNTGSSKDEGVGGEDIWKRTGQSSSLTPKHYSGNKSADQRMSRQSSTESEITKITGKKEESDSNIYGIEDQKKHLDRKQEMIAGPNHKLVQPPATEEQINVNKSSSSNTVSAHQQMQPTSEPNFSNSATGASDLARNVSYFPNNNNNYKNTGVRLTRNHTITQIPVQQAQPQHFFPTQILSPHHVIIQAPTYAAVYPQHIVGVDSRGMPYTQMSHTSRVKEQPQGLVVMERAKSVETSERKRYSRGLSHDDAKVDMSGFETETDTQRISKAHRSRSTISLPAHPAKLHETSFIESSPKTVNLLEHPFSSSQGASQGLLRSAGRVRPGESKESLFSVPPRFNNAPQSPFTHKRFNPTETDPRATPIFLDGGNIFSTKSGGVYRIKNPVNDLQGNDRRKETRYLVTNAHPAYDMGMGDGATADPDVPGTKSDSELMGTSRASKHVPLFYVNDTQQAMQVNQMNAYSQYIVAQHKQKKKKGLSGAGHAFKNKLQKFTKDLEAHLLPEIADASRAQNAMHMQQVMANQNYQLSSHGVPVSQPMTPMLAEFYDSRRQLRASQQQLNNMNQNATMTSQMSYPYSSSGKAGFNGQTMYSSTPGGLDTATHAQGQFQANQQVLNVPQVSVAQVGANIQMSNGEANCVSPNPMFSPTDSILSPSSSISGHNKLDAQTSPRHSGESSMGSLSAAAGINASAGNNSNAGSKICATPCYYRTMPGNKIQVIYPDSNRIFQYTYSRTLPPPNKKSSTQIIQQVQPDGTLSEEKLYFFDPIQLTDTQNEELMGAQMSQQFSQSHVRPQNRSASLGRSRSDGSSLEQMGREKGMQYSQTGAQVAYAQYPYSQEQQMTGSWLNRKKHTVRGLVKLTKELIK